MQSILFFLILESLYQLLLNLLLPSMELLSMFIVSSLLIKYLCLNCSSCLAILSSISFLSALRSSNCFVIISFKASNESVLISCTFSLNISRLALPWENLRVQMSTEGPDRIFRTFLVQNHLQTFLQRSSFNNPRNSLYWAGSAMISLPRMILYLW